jgi:hypothetical protein
MGPGGDIAGQLIDSYPGLRRFGDRWVRWGTTIADKVAAVLRLSVDHTPVAFNTIIAKAGEGRHNPSSISQVLYEDPRFARASQYSWALREWGLPEYSTVFAEIASRIDSSRNGVRTNDLVKSITGAFPDVAEASIRVYVTASAFVVDDHLVRRRTTADPWPHTPPLNTVRGAFRNGRNQIRLAFTVSNEVRRGSGQFIQPAAATALSVTPGEQRSFTGLTVVEVTWHLSTPRGSGAGIGTLRPFAAALDAQLGETLVLTCNLKASTVDAAKISADEPLRTRIPALVGQPAPTPPWCPRESS